MTNGSLAQHMAPLSPASPNDYCMLWDILGGCVLYPGLCLAAIIGTQGQYLIFCALCYQGLRGIRWDLQFACLTLQWVTSLGGAVGLLSFIVMYISYIITVIYISYSDVYIIYANREGVTVWEVSSPFSSASFICFK